MLNISYLGHAGFSIETKSTLLFQDIWTNDKGAYNSSWFQFPCNHHLTNIIIKQIIQTKKDIYIYISHEHKDHFDVEFFPLIADVKCHIIIGNFRRNKLIHYFSNFDNFKIHLCDDLDVIKTKDSKITIYLADAELNRDSGILFEHGDKSFLNLNDCKIYDRLLNLFPKGVTYLAIQFSGATWHPTCYNYTKEEYERISNIKKYNKYESVLNTIELLKPVIYIPSAGPVVFLDDCLLDKNFEKINIFPHIPDFQNYLKKNISYSLIYEQWMPGDIYSANESKFLKKFKKTNWNNFKEEIFNYKNKISPKLFDKTLKYKISETIKNINQILQKKLNQLKYELLEYSEYSILFRFFEEPNKCIQFDFVSKKTKIIDTSDITNTEITNDLGYDFFDSSDDEENNTIKRPSNHNPYYSIKVYLWEMEKIVDKIIDWEDWTLTFRTELQRNPDKYLSLLHGILYMEIEDIPFLERKLYSLKTTEKIKVTSNGKKYTINRYCPHQGADLTNADIIDDMVICPNHKWKFNLLQNGVCETSLDSICAQACTGKIVEIEDILKKPVKNLTLINKSVIICKEEPIIKFTFKDNINNFKNITYDNHFSLVLYDEKNKKIARSYSQVDINQKNVSFYIKIYKDGKFTNILNNLPIQSKIEYSIIERKTKCFDICNFNLCFMCGGTGVTPVYGILKYISNYNFNNSIKLISCWNNEKDIFLIDKIKKNIDINDIKYEFFVKNQKDNKYNTGYITSEYITKLIRGNIFNDTLSYYYYVLCGPDKMVESIKIILNNLGIKDEFIVYL